MKTSKAVMIPLLAVGLVLWRTEAFARQPKPGLSAPIPQLSAADESALRAILKDHETAWNKHDMTAFTKSFRDDADGINVVGMYWRGKAAILNHLAYYHQTNFKDLEETIDEVTTIHAIDGTHAIVVSIWKVGAFTAPNGIVIPACRHRNTLVLAKGADGWQVVHFHNTIIDEEAVKGAATTP